MSSTPNQIVLNGAHGEGGGALVRAAVAIASVTQQPVTVYNVRGKLRKKGLTAEDLAVIAVATDATSAELEGVNLQSEEFSFAPRWLPRPVSGEYDVSAYKKGTVPGNALTILASVLPLLARANGYSEIVIGGETHNEKTLGYDAFERSTLAAARRFGAYAFPRLLQAGFGYGAKGSVGLEIEPSVITPQEWPDRGALLSAGATVTLAHMQDKFAQEVVAGLQESSAVLSLDLDFDVAEVTATEPGASVTVWAEFERGFGSGTATFNRERGPDEVASLAFARFLEWYESEATVDPYLADQLLLIAAQAEGRTAITTPLVTQRLTTVAWVVRQFMPIHITFLGREGEPGTVTIER